MISTSGSGFSLVVPSRRRPKLMLMTTGFEKTGKTTFAFSAPAPIACITTDTGTEAVAELERKRGREIYLSRFLKVSSDDSIEEAKKKWQGIRRDIEWVIKGKVIRSLIIDTGGDLYDIARMAKFGRLEQVPPLKYGELNRELDELIGEVYDREGLNSIWIHKVKKEYEGKETIEKGMKVTKEIWMGKYRFSGYSQMPYHVDARLDHGVDFLPGIAAVHATVNGLYRNFGEKTAESLAGLRLEGDTLNFAFLASLMVPGSSEGDWKDGRS